MKLIGRIWRRLKQAYVYLLPLRFNVFAIAVLLFAFRFSDQGQDIMRALADGHSTRDLFVFIAASNFLAWEIWYWSRHLLRYRPHADDRRDEFRDPLPSDPAMRGLTEWIPRILGLLAFLVEIVGFVHASNWRLAAWLLVASAVVYVLFVWKRRDLFKLNASHLQDVTTWRKIGAAPLFWIKVAFAVEFVLFIWACVDPVSWRVFGVAGTLALTIAVWIPLGTLLIALGQWTRFPLATALIAWAFLISPLTDNHDIRNSAPQALNQRHSFEEAFTDYYNRVAPRHTGTPVPVIIVAAEGGGVRAAYWTATALTYLTDHVSGFTDHCFAISGVSGGSLGALVYDATLARRASGARPGGEVRNMLQYDALSGTLAALAQPDLMQRFVPFRAFPDRQAALERGWEAAWNDKLGGGVFGQPFVKMLNEQPTLPNLFLNGTVVETGERIIASNIALHPSAIFRNAFDAFDEMRVDIPLSSAAGMSARFTYVSPAGKIEFHPRCRESPCEAVACTNKTTANREYDRRVFGHVVDGGYFENSGAVTAAEIVAAARDVAAQHHWSIVPMVVFIDHWSHMVAENCPTSAPRPFCPAPGAAGPHSPLKAESFANEVMSPLRGVLNARDARGKEAIGDLVQNMSGLGGASVELRLAPPNDHAVPLPLGWILSTDAMDEIDAAMTQQHGNVAAVQILTAFLKNGTVPSLSCPAEKCADEAKGSTYGD
jgi:hypothetical protein